MITQFIYYCTHYVNITLHQIYI